jgi:hypothetical protein
MRVRVERSGGLAGLAARGERDEATLSPAERRAAEALLRAPPPSSARSPGADRFSYRVTIEHDGTTHELTVPEAAMPGELAAIAQVTL